MKKEYPAYVQVQSFINADVVMKTKIGWIPARPVSYPSIRYRFKWAWNVFIGKWDVLDWEGLDVYEEKEVK